MPPHFLADQLTLSQPGGGGTLSPPSITCHPGFSDLATALIHVYDKPNNYLVLEDMKKECNFLKNSDPKCALDWQNERKSSTVKK